jgi:hypothetical protein
MRQLLIFAALLAVALPSARAAVAPEAPHRLGGFGDWIAATHVEAGQIVCYAFTRARSSTPHLRGRGDVVLTVTERTGGRDAVAISAGYAYPAHAAVQLHVGRTVLEFYTAPRSAFARDGHAAVAAMLHGHAAVAQGSGPRHMQVSDDFSLRGFAAAYGAIARACPAPS